MERKAVSGIMLILLLVSVLFVMLDVPVVVASGTIYIRADGSIDPPTANVITYDYVTYYFTGNNYAEVVVERENIVINGNGYTLQGSGSGHGLHLLFIGNVTIKNTNIKNFLNGINVEYSPNNSIVGNNITNNDGNGVRLSGSSNSIISGNNITNNKWGIYLSSSSSNNISGNNITNNQYGIGLYESSNNMLRSNNMSDNRYNFGVSGLELSHFMNDVDVSNTVDSKPIYYWINKRDMVVPLDAGYVALVNCTRITVQNLNLTRNARGILLFYTTNTIITKNSITNNSDGIDLDRASNNTIFGNKITNNDDDGIFLYWFSSNNSISGNNITNNQFGITLIWGSNNISGNNITNNGLGICLYVCLNNNIYHNNFLNNTSQAYSDDYSKNVWDDGYPSGGNYWSDYTGVDADGDGIGDTPYIIDADNQDRYPLMGRWPPRSGDLNFDGVVNYKDASLFRQAYIGEYNPRADFNQDGVINYKDASLFRGYYIAG